ncbi:hypothetical protein N0V83_010862 [Neocucurbitaria cava]|uniref:Uncharacterized protein n=1 Tax=Neocucurbitaria cava TaxID=798079 RepID=A0A9W9CH90_9PLEO|nr:hypothetical protein N0V83_010862 [Neocucurbitaria cava]
MSQDPHLSATKGERLLTVQGLLRLEPAVGDPTWRPVTIELDSQDRRMDRRHLGRPAVTDDIMRLIATRGSRFSKEAVDAAVATLQEEDLEKRKEQLNLRATITMLLPPGEREENNLGMTYADVYSLFPDSAWSDKVWKCAFDTLPFSLGRTDIVVRNCNAVSCANHDITRAHVLISRLEGNHYFATIRKQFCQTIVAITTSDFEATDVPDIRKNHLSHLQGSFGHASIVRKLQSLNLKPTKK